MVAAILWMPVCRALGMNQIEYRAESIRLSRCYFDYDSYKNDPENLDPAENARVERLVSTAPIGEVFPDRKQMVDAVFEIVFPGYGVGSFGEAIQADGSVLALFAVEIPRAEKDRYLTFKRENGQYHLVDDFIEVPGFEGVRSDSRGLIYSLRQSHRTLERPARSHLR